MTTRMPGKREFCPECGMQAVTTSPDDRLIDVAFKVGKCFVCHATASKWSFLSTLENLPEKTRFKLRCGYQAKYKGARMPGRLISENPGYAAWYEANGNKRCPGQIEYTIEDIHLSYAPSGPAKSGETFPRRVRNGMTKACPECGEINRWDVLARGGNRSALLLLLPERVAAYA